MTVQVTKLENDGSQWFELTGTDYGAGREFLNDVYGLTDDNIILDADGIGMTEGDAITIAVRNSIGEN